LTSFSDEQLVEACRAGSQQHWRLLFERYKNYVAHIAWKMVGDTETARDLTQETFLRAVKGLKRFKGDSTFKTWLTRIVVNLCKDHSKGAYARHDKFHVPLDSPEEGGTGEIPDRDPSTEPETCLLQKELKTVVEAAMDKLSTDHKTVVLLWQQGFSYAEIAEITNTPENTVGTRIYYAKLEMRNQLKPYLRGTAR